MKNMLRFGPVLLIGLALAMASCSKPPQEPTEGTAMQVSSTSFQPGQAIADKYTSYGANVSPELSWKGAPPATKSFVLLVEDPDAPSSQPFVHWLVFNIPPSTSEVQEGKPPPGVGGQNDAGSTSYYGPKPPSGTHHYHFRIFAIDEELPLSDGASKSEVMNAIKGHTLGQGEVVGLYSH